MEDLHGGQLPDQIYYLDSRSSSRRVDKMPDLSSIVFYMNNYDNVRTAALHVVSTETRRVTLAALRAAAGLPARTAVEDGTDAKRIVFIILDMSYSGKIKTISLDYSPRRTRCWILDLCSTMQ